MGVGVFSSDFHETGHTFIVSPVNDDYESYVESMAGQDEDSILSRDRFYQTESDDFDNSVFGCISAMGAELGFDVNENALSGRRGYCHFTMDDDFVVLIENKFVQVGFCGWETDTIIGVAAKQSEFEEIPENFQLLDDYHLPLKKLEADYHALSQSVYRYALLSMQDGLFECRQKDTGYTSYRIDPGSESERAKEKEALQASIKALIAGLDKPQSYADALSDPDLREDLITDIHGYIDEYYNCGLKFYIPYVNLDENTIAYVDKDGDLMAESIMSPVIKDYFNKQNIQEGFHEIPLNDETRSFFQEKQAKNNSYSQVNVYISADEYRALDDGFELKSDDDSDLSL